MRTQAELLAVIADDTHALWKPSLVAEFNEAFGVSIQCREYAIGGGPKGLTLNQGVSDSFGLASFDLAPALCSALDVEYESMMGRGFQVRACIRALRNAGYPKD